MPVIDLLKGYFQIEDRDDHRRLREKVIGKLLNLEEALKASLTAFLALVDSETSSLSFTAEAQQARPVRAGYLSGSGSGAEVSDR